MKPSAIEFQFIRCDDGAVSGFDLGDIVVQGRESTCSSRGHSPDQSMMIYIALSELLGGVLRLCASKSKGSWTFVGADSSFGLVFILDRNKKITVMGAKKVIAVTDPEELLTSLAAATAAFLDASKNALPTSDPVFGDLAMSLRELAIALRNKVEK